MASTEATVSSPLFLKSAEDLEARLAREPGEVAAAMALEAHALGELFRGWQLSRPAEEARFAAIDQLMDLNRRAMEYLCTKGRTSVIRELHASRETDAEHGPPPSGVRRS